MKKWVAIVLCTMLLAVPLAAYACPPPEKVTICHRDQGKPEWKLIEISINALDAHLKHQWGADIYPVPEGGCPEPPPSPPPPVCEVRGSIWYLCESGAWLYGSGTLQNCPWCGGLTGDRVVKESYDCGETWYWYYNGEPIPPMTFLGRYPCNTSVCK